MSYYYADADGRKGPFTEEQLRGRTFPARTLFWREGLSDWVPLIQLPELRDVVNASPVSAPPDRMAHAALRDAHERSRTPLKDEPGLHPATAPPGFSLARAFSFEGRISIWPYRLSVLALFFYLFAAARFAYVVAGTSPEASFAIQLLLYLPGIWFGIAQAAKRCHDRGNSGWFQLVPFYGFILFLGEGEPFTNRFGPDPKTHLRR